MLRYVRDIHSHLSDNQLRHINPQFWFYNYPESIIQKYEIQRTKNNKKYIAKQDHIYNLCNVIKQIVLNDKYKSKESKSKESKKYYFNDKGEVNQQNQQTDKYPFKIKKFKVGDMVDIPAKNISGKINEITNEDYYVIFEDSSVEKFTKEQIQHNISEYNKIFKYLRSNINPCLF